MRVNIIASINWHFIAHVTNFVEAIQGLFNMLLVDIMIPHVKVTSARSAKRYILPPVYFMPPNKRDFLKYKGFQITNYFQILVRIAQNPASQFVAWCVVKEASREIMRRNFFTFR